MALTRYILPGALFFVWATATAGCVSQEYVDEAAYVDSWDWYAPHAKLFIDTDPSGAEVEIMGIDGEFVVIGSTPVKNPIVLEATGKTYVIRVSKPGFFPETREIALPNADSSMTIPMRRDVYAEPANYMYRDYHGYKTK